MDLWTRIRKARLFQVLAVYVALAWVVLQVADVLEDALELPPWVTAATLLLLLAGLIIVGATAWLQTHPPTRPEADGRVTRREALVHRWVLPQLTWRRALLGGVIAFVVFGVVTAAVMLLRPGGGVGPAEARAEEAGVGLAVLPFHVTGPDADIWREGMLDLLTTNLDGVGGLRAIDPATILARLPRDATDDRTRLEAARAAGARFALLGSAVSLGPAVRLTAEVHDLLDGGIVARARGQGAQDSVLSLVDALSIDVVRQLLGSPGGGMPRIRSAESLTTSSLQALRAWLEGETLFRRGELMAAASAYERAISADSSFALAHWRLALAQGWQPGAANQAQADSTFAHVVAHLHRLPPRARLLVRADSLRRAGEYEAVEVSGAATRRYPDDPEAWYLLGESRFHLGNPAGYSLDEVIEPFQRAVELDPSTGPYYYHLIPSLIGMGETARADALLETFLRATGDSARAAGWQLARDLAWGTASGDEARADQRIARASSEELYQAAVALGFTMAWPREVQRLIEAAADQGVPVGSMYGLWIPAMLEQGKLRALLEAVMQDRGFATDRFPLILHVRMLGGDVPPETLEQHFQPEMEGGAAGFWTGTDAALREDWDRFERSRAALRQAAEAASDSAAAATLRLQLAGLGALELGFRHGRHGPAADSLDSVLRRFDAAAGLLESVAITTLRGLQGELYLNSGRAQELLTRLEPQMAPRPSPMQAFSAARAHDQLGNTEEAVRLYTLFLDGWRDADPGLPWAQEARAALARLRPDR